MPRELTGHSYQNDSQLWRCRMRELADSISKLSCKEAAGVRGGRPSVHAVHEQQRRLQGHAPARN